MKPVKWGIISTAKIAVEKVVPAMMANPMCDIVAIASRDQAKADAAAARLGIGRAYGRYEDLFADPEVEAVYNPLPNNMHVPLSIAAAEAGKHVLCEKPIALTAAETENLIAARDRTGMLIVEAFMVRHHPQLRRARDLVREGAIGQLRAIQAAFTYFNDDAGNIRNKAAMGGGALYDIGVYPIVTTRFLFGAEPRRVLGLMERDPDFGTDRLTSGLLDFEAGQASFICATQLIRRQGMQVYGTKGRIEIPVPFTPPPEQPTRLLVIDTEQVTREETFAAVDQYGLQGEAFARHLRAGTQPEFPLEDSRQNMAVVDALFRSAREDRWIAVAGS